MTSVREAEQVTLSQSLNNASQESDENTASQSISDTSQEPDENANARGSGDDSAESDEEQEGFKIDDLTEGFFTGDCDGPSSSPPPETAALYCRVSSDQQAREGYSISTQKKKTKEIAEEHDLTAAYGPIVDDGESASNFAREGLEEVACLAAQGEITHIVVTKYDRLAREPYFKGLALVCRLNELFGVKVVTEEQGELATEGPQKIMTILSAFMSDEENRTRTKTSQDGQITKFKSGDYSIYHDNSPLGYEELDPNDGALVPIENELKTVDRMFKTFLRVGENAPYKETLNRVETLPDDWDSGQLKNHLQKSVYIGAPSANTHNVSYYEWDEVVFYDASLRCVPVETFRKVQEKIDGMRVENSGESSKPDEQLFERNIPEDVLDIVGIFRPHCPECDGILRRNGTRSSGGKKVQAYYCEECDTNTRAPTLAESEELKAKRKEKGIQVEL